MEGTEKDDGGQVSVAIKTDLQRFHHLDLEKENTVLIVVEIETSNCISVICDLVHFLSPFWFLLRDFRWIELFSSRKRWVRSYWFGWRCICPPLTGPPIYRCNWLFTGSQVVDNIFCELVGDNFLLLVQITSGSRLDLFCWAIVQNSSWETSASRREFSSLEQFG